MRRGGPSAAIDQYDTFDPPSMDIFGTRSEGCSEEAREASGHLRCSGGYHEAMTSSRYKLPSLFGEVDYDG